MVDEKNSDPVMLDFWCENKKHWALLVVTIMHELVLILIMTLMIFLILIFVDFFSATISLLILIFISFFYLMFWKKKLEQIGKIQISSKRNMFKWIIQSLSMIKEIIITNKTARAVDEYLKNVFLFEQSKRKMQIIQGIPSAFFELLIVILILISILFVTSAEIENPIPILSLYTIAAIRLLPIFSRFSSYMASIHSILNLHITK